MAVAEPVVVGISDSSAERARRRSLCGSVHDGLRVGDVVHRRDHAMPDPESFVDHLDHRGEAVGRAGSGGQDVMRAGLVQMVVDAHDDIQRALLDRRRDDYLPDAAFEVAASASRSSRNLPEHSRTISTSRRVPGHRAGASRRAEADALAVDRQTTPDPQSIGTAPAPVDAVEFEQVRGGLGTAFDLVDMDDRELAIPNAARSASRPIRPKPLIPTRTNIICFPPCCNSRTYPFIRQVSAGRFPSPGAQSRTVRGFPLGGW